MNEHRLQVNFFLILLLAFLVLSAYIFLPSLSALVIGLTLAVIGKSLYRAMRALVRWESLAAFITVLMLVGLIFAPLSLFGYQIFQQTSTLYQDLANPNGAFRTTAWQMIQDAIQRVLPNINLDFPQYLRQVLTWFIQNLGSVFSGLTQVVFTVFLSLIALFYFLKDGERFQEGMIRLLPLDRKYSEAIFLHTERAVNSVVVGILAVAVIQGIVSGIGFWIFDLPQPAFWGAVTVIAALVPTLGTSLVIVPAVIYLLITGNTIGGAGLALWGALAVGLIDNFLGPKLIHHGINIHPLFILLSVLGGVAVFGPIGFLAGPITLAVLVALLDIYPKLILERGER